MSAAHEARDLREARLHRALSEVVTTAFIANIASAAREHVAVEDFDAMLNAIVGDLDEAGLSVVNREDLAAYLLSHQGNEDSGQWQDGHDYAMREAARLVEGAWDQIEFDRYATATGKQITAETGADLTSAMAEAPRKAAADLALDPQTAADESGNRKGTT